MWSEKGVYLLDSSVGCAPTPCACQMHCWSHCNATVSRRKLSMILDRKIWCCGRLGLWECSRERSYLAMWMTRHWSLGGRGICMIGCPLRWLQKTDSSSALASRNWDCQASCWTRVVVATWQHHLGSTSNQIPHFPHGQTCFWHGSCCLLMLFACCCGILGASHRGQVRGACFGLFSKPMGEMCLDILGWSTTKWSPHCTCCSSLDSMDGKCSTCIVHTPLGHQDLLLWSCFHCRLLARMDILRRPSMVLSSWQFGKRDASLTICVWAWMQSSCALSIPKACL